MGFDVIILNENNILVVDGNFRNSDPYECADENPLDKVDVGVCILNSLLLLKVMLM